MFVLVKEKKFDRFMFLLSGTIHPLAAAAACQQLLSMWLLTTHTHNTRNTKHETTQTDTHRIVSVQIHLSQA